MIWRNGGPYFTCMRTNHKWPISDMSWDNGLLVCNQYRDRAINGSFELRVAKEGSKKTTELQPDPKIINPVDPTTQLRSLPFSVGGV